MIGTIKIFKDKEDIFKIINNNFEDDDFEMIKRNYPYGKCIGYQGGYYGDGYVGFASLSVDDEEMHIYTFEISRKYQAEGYGREFYEDLLELYKPSLITLDPLDDEAECFWTHMGFKWNNEYEYMYKEI
jgi:ribosomal protein S18 acetylase RimI-like enzyme